jgi:hypothetical protein
MTTLVMCVWLAIATGPQAAPWQGAWLKGFEGVWLVDNARGADADIVLTTTLDAKGVLLLRVAYGGGESSTRYDLSGKDVTNSAPGSKNHATFRTHIESRKLVTEIWDATPDGPPQRIETRWLDSADVMVTELSKTPGGPAFNRTVLRRAARAPRGTPSSRARASEETRRVQGRLSSRRPVQE